MFKFPSGSGAFFLERTLIISHTSKGEKGLTVSRWRWFRHFRLLLTNWNQEDRWIVSLAMRFTLVDGSKTRLLEHRSGWFAGFLEIKPRFMQKSFGSLDLKDSGVFCQLESWWSLSLVRISSVWRLRRLFISGSGECCHNPRKRLLSARAFSCLLVNFYVSQPWW